MHFRTILIVFAFLCLAVLFTSSLQPIKQLKNTGLRRPPRPQFVYQSLWNKFKRLIVEDKAAIIVPQAEDRYKSGKSQEPGPDYRLPDSVIPTNYFVRIRPIIDRNHTGVGLKNTAPGYIRITTTCVKPTNLIVLHVKFLNVNVTSIQIKSNGNGDLIPISKVTQDEPRNFLSIELTAGLVVNEEYEISMNYIANVPVGDALRGLYSEEYIDPRTMATKVMAATQLEPLRARQVFPCMDEPTYKATFDVVIGRTENFTSLANSHLIGTQPDSEHPGWFWDTFNTTVKMPTYLFAIAVSQYSYSQATEGLYRLPVRVYAPQHLIEQGRGQLTADASAMIIQYFENKYGIPHNMPKIDSISVPYKGGAMENYGLITYGQYLLMYYNETTLSTELRGIYNVLAHELGHQWFGNLVTCKWWSDIWLNEGFATYVSHEAGDQFWPEFDFMKFMVHDAVNSALEYDAGPNSHPVHQEAYTASQIAVNMDSIGYDKGASLVRMMVSFLGEETFYNGIERYLNAFYDSVAEQDNLFENLNAAANEAGLELPVTIKEIMDTWTLQKGFPLIRVNMTGADLVFSQETWQNANVRNETSDPGTSWHVPITFSVEMGQGSVYTGALWLPRREGGNGGAVNVSMPNVNGWVLANPDAGGYYRTIYDTELAGRLQNQLELNHLALPAVGRVRLIDDQFTLGYQKYIPIQSSLEFTKYLGKETDSIVWTSAFANLQKIRNLYRSDLPFDFNALRRYLIPRIDAAMGTVLSQQKQKRYSAEAILESQLVEWSCWLKSNWCTAYGTLLFSQWTSMPSTNPVPNEIQSTMYCQMVADKGDLAFLFIFQRYSESESKQQKGRLIKSLACVQEEANLSTLVNMVLGPEYGIEVGDSLPIFQQMMLHTQGRAYLLKRLSENPKEFVDYYNGKIEDVAKIFAQLANTHGTVEDVLMFEQFINSNSDLWKGSLDNILKTMRQNVEWMTDFRDPITSWLEANSD